MFCDRRRGLVPTFAGDPISSTACDFGRGWGKPQAAQTGISFSHSYPDSNIKTQVLIAVNDRPKAIGRAPQNGRPLTYRRINNNDPVLFKRGRICKWLTISLQIYPK